MHILHQFLTTLLLLCLLLVPSTSSTSSSFFSATGTYIVATAVLSSVKVTAVASSPPTSSSSFIGRPEKPCCDDTGLTCTTIPPSFFSRHHLLTLCGGGNVYDSDDDEDDNTNDDTTITPTDNPGPLLDSVKSLFRLNADAKENALEEELGDEHDVLAATSSSASTDPSTRRGGALVMAAAAKKQQHEQEQQEQKQQRPVMDTSRVATASSRLLPPEEDDDDDDQTATTADATLSELDWGEDDDDEEEEDEDDDDGEYEYEYENEDDEDDEDDIHHEGVGVVEQPEHKHQQPQEWNIPQHHITDHAVAPFTPVESVANNVAKIWWANVLLEKNARKAQYRIRKYDIEDSDDEEEEVEVTVVTKRVDYDEESEKEEEPEKEKEHDMDVTPIREEQTDPPKSSSSSTSSETIENTKVDHEQKRSTETAKRILESPKEQLLAIAKEEKRIEEELQRQRQQLAEKEQKKVASKKVKQKPQSPKEQLQAIADEEKLIEQEQTMKLEQEENVEDGDGTAPVKMDLVVPSQPNELVTPQLNNNAFVSSGYWQMIDKVTSFGFSTTYESMRLSRKLRSVRKATARVTGLHGVLSGKGRDGSTTEPKQPLDIRESSTLDENDLRLVRRRIAAISKARELLKLKTTADTDSETPGPKRRFGLFRRRNNNNNNRGVQNAVADQEDAAADLQVELLKASLEDGDGDLDDTKLQEGMDEAQRKERVQAIDKLIARGQKDLLELQCEKDSLQRRPNPLYNYTTSTENSVEKTTRTFNFPSQALVDEYLQELFSIGRLVKLNHTDLWKSNDFDDDEDESIGDDLLTPSADAHKLYQNKKNKNNKNGRRKNGQRRNGNGNGGGGSWLLRQSIGKGGSLGAKIGEAAETSGYQAVCNAVMAALARSLAGLHGINLMAHSDIRLSLEQSADLPPVAVNKNIIPGSEDMENYAQTAIKNAIQKGSKKHKRRHSKSKHHSHMSEAAFIQRDAVVETLLSHCQISAPLLKLFPLAWQRGLIGNMIDLITAIVSDFAGGIQLQILGHVLTFSFKPITGSDMIAHFAAGGFNSRRGKAREFEAAVRATAQDVREDLKFLDGWHERALGSGMLRDQLANLIARLVLTLTDEVLGGARMDLWSAQANGPRLVAGLEHRTTATH